MKHSGTGPENIAARSSGTVTDLFNQFMEEKDVFDRSNYRAKFVSGSYNGEVIGHYSQIVWASNTKVGCGLANCSSLGFVYGLFMVCRYQTGNILGYEVYGLGSSTTTSSTSITTTTTTIESTSTQGLTQQQKDTLLNLHRQARAAVNAPNMQELYWDNELANIAQVNNFLKIKEFFF